MRRFARLWLVGCAVAITLCGPAGATSPGSLPQTTAEPSFGAPLRAQMDTLFSAITANSLSVGSKVFFPEAAYVRMKTGEIANPTADYVDRLIAFYSLDLAAYHQRLLVAPRARLIAVEANSADAQWIPAGDCENSIGYWHLPGVRLVLRRGTQVVSVAVASLISWRGVWYVVHLGPNPRPYNVGTVDGYQSGPGTPGPAGGC